MSCALAYAVCVCARTRARVRVCVCLAVRPRLTRSRAWTRSYWLGAKGAWRRARPLVRKNLADGLSGAKLDQAILKLFDEMDPEHGYVTTAELQTWLNGKTARSAAPFTPDEVREMVDEVTTDISGKGLYLQDFNHVCSRIYLARY
eukprot:3517396-Rhodomonas_salina.1